MAKYMGYYYAGLKTDELNRLRSEKFLKLQRLQTQASTYLNMQERKRLTDQIVWIDAELQCRRDRMAFDAI